ncbi:MAG: hypothetical protein FD126_1741 [Elusimicrobia bacterium]|nr:MAG: hypothetical protein FD126_1741 [Elusimicrobiota bacterium]
MNRVFMLTALLLAVPAQAGTRKGKPRRTEAVMSRVEDVTAGRFKATPPKGWRVTKDAEGGALQVTGPEGSGGPAPKASAVFYAKGNPHFKDAADFLARQTAPTPVPIEGEKTGSVEDVKLSGRRAKRLRRDTFAVYRPPGGEPRDVALREEVTVLEGKEGFWVLTETAPPATWPRHAAAFAAFRDGFRAND